MNFPKVSSSPETRCLCVSGSFPLRTTARLHDSSGSAEAPSPQSRTVHLSYHDGEHYNSVRLTDDFNPGAATPIPEAAPASVAATSRKVHIHPK